LIVRTSVPSFFSFFSCDEQLDNAHNFYDEISKQAKADLAVRIIDPFFNSPSTFRFLEHALDRFFRTFLLDFAVTPDTERNSLIPHHSEYLLQCFTAAVPLLPRQHLSLLQKLHLRRWPPQCFAELFLVRFLWPATIRWLKNSPHDAQLPYLECVLVKVGDQKAQLTEFWKAIYHTSSVYEVPQLFYAFDHYHLLYYLCVNDIILIARMLKDQKMLPKSTTYAEFVELDRRYQFNWFWCQVFPWASTQPSGPRRNLIFTRTPELRGFAADPDFSRLREDFQKLLKLVNAFESFLEQSRKFRRLREWDDLIATNANHFLVGDIEYLVAHPQIVVSREIWQFSLIARIDQELLRRHKGQMAEFAQAWNEKIAKCQDGRQLKKLLSGRECARQLVWQGIRKIRCIAKARFDRTFRTYITAIMQFQRIGEVLGIGPELLQTVLAQLPGEVVLVPFIIFGGAVGRVKTFMSDVEKKAWVTLEQCILKMLGEDLELMVQVFSEQNEISAVAQQCLGNV
jgi:hypothetical protein